jgi:hypothetical protein
MRSVDLKIKLALSVIIFISTTVCAISSGTTPLHPLNKRNIEFGLMPYPMYFPDVPRITARYAKSLYDDGKALFVYVGASDTRIIGGIGMTEGEMWKFDAKNFNLKDDRILVVY